MARLSTTKNTTLASNRMRRNAFFLTAAAALSKTSSVDAFVAHPSQQQQRSLHHLSPSVMMPSNRLLTTTPTTRLYSSSKKNDNFLKKAAKKILPASWFQSEEEKEAALARQQVKDNVKGGIKELLKDAPLPVRMLGSMISPLLSKAASQMGEAMAEQEKTIETVLDDARAYILGDDVALQALGEPLQVGAPFSQSSSTSIINGQKTTNIAIGFPVNGSRSSGMAQAQATDKGIQRLTLQVDGRQINVSLTQRGSPSSRVGKNHRTFGPMNDDDNIIEAEIIEKKVEK